MKKKKPEKFVTHEMSTFSYQQTNQYWFPKTTTINTAHALWDPQNIIRGNQTLYFWSNRQNHSHNTGKKGFPLGAIQPCSWACTKFVSWPQNASQPLAKFGLPFFKSVFYPMGYRYNAKSSRLPLWYTFFLNYIFLNIPIPEPVTLTLTLIINYCVHGVLFGVSLRNYFS